MGKVVKPPEKADDEARAEGLPGLASILGHAPQLTKNWGRFLAFLGVLTTIALVAVSARPEAAHFALGVYVVCISAAALAAHMRWLD
jgi:hypothetical protein